MSRRSQRMPRNPEDPQSNPYHDSINDPSAFTYQFSSGRYGGNFAPLAHVPNATLFADEEDFGRARRVGLQPDDPGYDRQRFVMDSTQYDPSADSHENLERHYGMVWGGTDRSEDADQVDSSAVRASYRSSLTLVDPPSGDEDVETHHYADQPNVTAATAAQAADMRGRPEVHPVAPRRLWRPGAITLTEECERFAREISKPFGQMSAYEGKLAIPLFSRAWTSLTLGQDEGLTSFQREALYHMITEKTIMEGRLLTLPKPSPLYDFKIPQYASERRGADGPADPETELKMAGILLHMEGRPMEIREEMFGLYDISIREQVKRLGDEIAREAREARESEETEMASKATQSESGEATTQSRSPHGLARFFSWSH